MNKTRLIALVAAASFLCSSIGLKTPAQTGPITAIGCGRLINPADGSITLNAIVIIKGQRVEQTGAGLRIPDGARVIDLSAYTVLPGLIDCHTHINAPTGR